MSLCPEKYQKRSVKAGNQNPGRQGQNYRSRNRQGKIFVGPFDSLLLFSADGAKKHGTADSHQKTQAVNNVPYRSHHGQGRRSFRSVILAHHGHVHDGVNGGNQGASESCRKILEIKRFDVSIQKIHVETSPLLRNTIWFLPEDFRKTKKERTRNRHFSPCLIQLLISCE